jgi:hypothetical protein
MIQETDKLLAEAQNFLLIDGKKAIFNDWITIQEYSKRFGVKMNTVMNWISRGTIGKGDVIIVTELNNLKLIRAIEYK